MAKLVDQDAETPHRVAEACSGLGTGKALDKECPQGLILSVMSVAGLEEEPGIVRYLCSFTDKHNATISHLAIHVKAKKTSWAKKATQPGQIADFFARRQEHAQDGASA